MPITVKFLTRMFSLHLSIQLFWFQNLNKWERIIEQESPATAISIKVSGHTLADDLHLKNVSWLFWSASWGLESEFETAVREWYLTKYFWAQICMLPGSVQCILTVLIILSLGVQQEWRWEEEGGGGGRDGLANPTSPMDREQMGPDTLHTNHCQGSFSCSCDRFKMTTHVYSNMGRVQ